MPLASEARESFNNSFGEHAVAGKDVRQLLEHVNALLFAGTKF